MFTLAATHTCLVIIIANRMKVNEYLRINEEDVRFF